MCQSNIALKNFCVFEKKHKIPIFSKSCLGVMYHSNIDLKRFSIFSCFRKRHLIILWNRKKSVKKNGLSLYSFPCITRGGLRETCHMGENLARRRREKIAFLKGFQGGNCSKTRFFSRLRRAPNPPYDVIWIWSRLGGPVNPPLFCQDFDTKGGLLSIYPPMEQSDFLVAICNPFRVMYL